MNKVVIMSIFRNHKTFSSRNAHKIIVYMPHFPGLDDVNRDDFPGKGLKR